MCGRFTQMMSWRELHDLADLIGREREIKPRHNIAPGSQIEAIRPAGDRYEMVPMRWGLVPSWWKKPLAELPSSHMARAETVAEKAMFRSACKSRRCVIPASGFYEWSGEKGSKTPHYFSPAESRVMFMAAIWESWRDPVTGDDLLSVAVITTASNRWMERFHNRQPVTLNWADAQEWMRGANPGAFLHAPVDDALREWEVSKRVNNARFGDDDPTLINPV